jgi:hypothetical protein
VSSSSETIPVARLAYQKAVVPLMSVVPVRSCPSCHPSSAGAFGRACKLVLSLL